MKRIICIFLAILIASMCVINTVALDKTNAATDLPTMYIGGQGADLPIADENGKRTGEYLYPVEYNTDEILESVNLLHQPFAKGVATGDWNDWCDTFVEIITPLFESYSMDENGNSQAPVYMYERNVGQNCKNEDGKISLNTFQFNYDWRADPVESTKRLNNYIKKLLNRQKFGDVNMVGRCIGGNVLLAYLADYNLSNINSAVFYCEGFEGFEIIGKLFTGDISIDADALSRFADDYLSDGEYRDDEIYGMITDLISVLNTMKTLGVFVSTFDDIYSKVYSNVLPRILRKSFGTMPSFWALVGDEYYEDAKKFVFGDEAETTYAALIEKIDNFHYNYLLKYKDIIKKATDSGVKVYNVVKYGMQIFPTGGDNYIQSDTILETLSASAGANCCRSNTKFTDEYLATIDLKYISPDKQIDASTCLMPDHTWFIKNLSHMYMPEAADEVIAYLLDGKSYISAPECEEYPQFLLYDKGTELISPMTEENGDIDNHPNFFRRLISFFKHLFSIISDFFNEKIEEIKESRNKQPTE